MNEELTVTEAAAQSIKENTSTEPVDAPDLSATDILAADDLATKRIFVPQWKGYVTIRTLSADDAIDLSKALSDPAQKHSAPIRVVQKSLIDTKTGQPQFTEHQIGVL